MRILFPVACAPIVEDNAMINHADIAAIVVKNAGTATVLLFDGLYTLDPKESLTLNVTEPNASLHVQNIPVTFDTSTGGVKRLEVLLLKSETC